MLRSGTDFGISLQTWNAAKKQARDIMINRARRQGMIPYSDLVVGITEVEFEPHDTRLFHLLGEISCEESEAGRGMLTAIVVHKHGDMQPGPGFFELANLLGHDTGDILRFWVNELKRVHAYWSKPTTL
jgi:hypothetical protein